MIPIKQKHIGILTSYFPSSSETFVVNHVTGLIDFGFKVSILARKKESIEKTSQPSIFQEYNLLSKTQQYLPEIPLNRFDKFFFILKNLFKKSYNFFSFFKIVLFRKEGSFSLHLKQWFNVIKFSQFNEISFFQAHFGINSEHIATMHELGAINKPFSATFHGVGGYAQTKDMPNLKKKYEYLFNKAEFITVNSRYLANNLINIGCEKKKIHIIPIGVDTKLFKFKNRIVSNEIELVSVGRLVELKGHIYALEAVKILVDNGYQVNYTIVGEGDFESQLKLKIESLSLTKNVSVVGKKNQDEIIQIFHNSDIFVFPSITDSSGRAEAFGLASIEAQATGLPVIAFNSGGIMDTIADNKSGFLVPEKDIVKLASALEILINDPDKRYLMGKYARSWIEKNFNLDKILAKNIELVNKIKIE
ncbi:MAG: glycosyltransferase [Patiriisocius sp.]|uniref:glycosyltransferase n=1 Tax=Patiriisocius sp. TaxID=2822396 RepID=UPI003EF0E382